MPEKKTVERAKEDLREGKRPSTAAGEFVREEMHHIREGKHGAKSTKQAIAIGLSKARRAGVPLEPPSEGQTSERTRESAERAYEVGQGDREPRAPSEMEGANLLITNHALFFSDLALRSKDVGFLPAYQHVVLDEAHNAEDVAADHFGLSLSEGRVMHLLTTLYQTRSGKG